MVQYTRETLYEEVWNEPVSTVAKKYGVSDVAIHKICKSMDIPAPLGGIGQRNELVRRFRRLLFLKLINVQL